MLPDTPTIIVFSILLMGFLGLLQLWLWRCDRSLSTLAIWGGAELVGTVAMGLLLARNIWPHWITIQLGVALLALTAGLVWTGARRFEQQPAPWIGMLVGPTLWLMACQVPFIYQDLANRVLVGSVIIAGYNLLCMREFGRPRCGAELPSRAALVALFGANVVIQFARTIAVLTASHRAISYDLPGSAWFGITSMIGVVLLAGTSVLLIAVAKEEAEQASIATLAAARDAADSANQAKSRFLTRMSHELRTPLNGVLGMAQVLTRDPQLQGEQRERAATLEQAGRHLLAIINDILDLASVETGTFHLTPQPTALAAVIQGSLDFVAETAAAKRVTLTLREERALPRFLRADPLRVRQILLNLLGNAIRFTPPDGTVTLSVGWRRNPAMLRLEVADTGRGVPAALRPHLFRDMAQRPLDMAATDGTGLGLAISASLAHAMGGALRYQPGQGDIGSIFTAELPLAEAAAPPAEETLVVQPSRPIAGLHVLVVDDVASNRKLAQAVLQQAGCTVSLAEDGATAVAALLAGERPDVVLMDVFMPELDGVAATRRIRSLAGPASQVPIIALTADASPDRVPAYLQAGMDDCVTKPFAVDALLDAISRATSLTRTAVVS